MAFINWMRWLSKKSCDKLCWFILKVSKAIPILIVALASKYSITFLGFNKSVKCSLRTHSVTKHIFCTSLEGVTSLPLFFNCINSGAFSLPTSASWQKLQFNCFPTLLATYPAIYCHAWSQKGFFVWKDSCGQLMLLNIVYY